MKMLKNSKGDWDWLKVLIPVLTIVIVPLIALVYNNMAEAIEKKADGPTTELNIKTLKEKVELKVDNKTLLLLLQQYSQQQDFMQEQIKEQKTIDNKTLDTLMELNVQMKLIEQQLKKE